ncbi:MAG: DnaJ domain-containing protein [Candidatus Dadabacteria bacterium]|nr:DnaJ domain-containing protein [Candidatus Dadabacteria bacterium]
MIILDKRKYERIVSELIDAKDIRELAERFSLDRIYYYHILKDVSSGRRSPNYKLLEGIAERRKLSVDFIVEQSKSVLNFFVPYYQSHQSDSLDYYKVLNVPRNATEEEIRRNWIELMKSHHPDMAGAQGLDASKQINEAYEVLSSSTKREAYDNKHLPAMPVIVPQNEMRKYYYAASLMLVVFLVVMYASGSGLIFESREEKERLAREFEAPDMPNTVYKGDLLDSEKVESRISEIKPIEPAREAAKTQAGKDEGPKEKAGEMAAKAPDKPAGDKAAQGDNVAAPGTELTAAGLEDEAASQSKTESKEIAAVKSNETVPQDKAETPAAEPEPEKAVEIAEVTSDEPGKKAAPAVDAPVKDKAPEVAEEEALKAQSPEIKEATTALAAADQEPKNPVTAENKEVAARETAAEAEVRHVEKETVPQKEIAEKPAASEETKGEITEISIPTKEKAPAQGEYYTVRKGDNLWTIARKFDTTTAKISRLNDLGNNKLDVGDKLLISGDGTAKPKPAPELAAADVKKEDKAEKVEKVKKVEKMETAEKTEPAPLPPVKKEKLPEPLITKAEEPVKPPEKTDITADFNPNLATSAVAIRDTAVRAPAPVPPAAPPDQDSVYVFVSEYVSAYRNRDINRVKALFAPDAVENGVGISRVFDSYSANFSKLDIVSYEVKVKRVSVQNTLGQARGDFYITFKDQRTGVTKSSKGNINWRLSWTDGAWKIQELTYKIENTDTVGG